MLKHLVASAVLAMTAGGALAANTVQFPVNGGNQFNALGDTSANYFFTLLADSALSGGSGFSSTGDLEFVGIDGISLDQEVDLGAGGWADIWKAGPTVLAALSNMQASDVHYLTIKVNNATWNYGVDSYLGSVYIANPQGGSITSVTPGAVPEPETYAMMLAGLGALGFMARRRQAK